MNRYCNISVRDRYRLTAYRDSNMGAFVMTCFNIRTYYASLFSGYHVNMLTLKPINR